VRCIDAAGELRPCIVDFESRRVVGVHFGGLPDRKNFATPLFRLASDSTSPGAAWCSSRLMRAMAIVIGIDHYAVYDWG
jgi:hypothetical protein